LVLKAFKEQAVQQDQLDHLLQDPKVIQEAKDRLAQLDPQDLQEAQAMSVVLDPQVLLDLQVVQAAQGLLDPQGQQE